MSDNKPVRSYTAKNIITAGGLLPVRLTPTQFITHLNTKGQLHLIGELTSNAFDEHFLKFIDHGERPPLTIVLIKDIKNETYQMIIKDNGRGIPIESLFDSICVLHTSGKFDIEGNATTYASTGGQFGIGAKAATGASKDFKGITMTEDGYASVYAHQGNPDQIIIDKSVKPKESGYCTIFEFDKLILSEINTFSSTGYLELLFKLRALGYFKTNNIIFKSIINSVPNNFWKKGPVESMAYIDSIINKATTEYSSLDDTDTISYLRSYLNINRPFVWELKLDAKDGDSYMFNIEMYYTKMNDKSKFLSFVNNIQIDDNESTHNSTIEKVLKKIMGPMILDEAIKKFFMSNMYTIPLYYAINMFVKYAKLAGSTKHGYYDDNFEKVYTKVLHELFQQNIEKVNTLFSLIKDDVERLYNISILGKTERPRTSARFYENLNFPNKFVNCMEPGHPDSELILVEGDSAKNVEGRNSKYQAIYALRGVPMNALKLMRNQPGDPSAFRSPEILKKLKANDIFYDIMTILNIDLHNFDVTKLNFRKIIIATDADEHGYHIASLLIGNLYAMCPKLIETGMVHVAMPPLYGLKYKGDKSTKDKIIYLRDSDAVTEWMANVIYREALSISYDFKGKRYTFTDVDYIGSIKKIMDIGNMMQNISNELNIDLQILEMLTHVTKYLEYGCVDVNKIKEILSIDNTMESINIHYHEKTHNLIFEIGREDISIPLYNVRERLYESILPVLNEIGWKEGLQFYVTTNHNPNYIDYPVSIMQLYTILKSFDKYVELERYKGLGSMNPSDLGRIYSNPNSRRIFQITSVGSINDIYNMLGGQSDTRKDIFNKPEAQY